MSDIPLRETSVSRQHQIADFFGALTNAQRSESSPFSNAEYGEVVVRQALNWREQASGEAHQAFDAAVRESGVRVQGFQNAERAPAFRLQGPLFQAVHRSDGLAGAVLRMWAEANQSLHEAVVTHLEDRDLPTDGLDFPGGRFRGSWSLDRCQTEQDRIIQIYGDQYDRDDVALMLCYVSGNRAAFPDDGSEEATPSPTNDMLDGCLAYLQELSPYAAEWERLIPAFIVRVGDIIESKRAERDLAARLDRAIEEVGTDFSGELTYLELRTESWSAALLASPAAASEALELVAGLKASLGEYRPIREQAPVRSEEQARAASRTQLEASVLSIVDRIRQLNTGEEGAGDLGPQPRPDPAEEPATNAPPDLPLAPQSLAAELTPTGDLDPLRGPETNGNATESAATAEAGPSPAPTVAEDSGAKALLPEAPAVAASAVSEAEYTALQTENLSLEQELGYAREEAELLRDDLRDNLALAESWRLAYETERQESANKPEPEMRPIADVHGAVRLAREKFREQIIFQPNSESEIEDNPFNTPETVWKALQWLATIYYQSRIGNLREPDFDRSIREACGWWYKSDQHDTTMGRYPSSYTTKVDGRTYRLEEHIGKGTNWDARYTIRIAFDWDRSKRKVIVGYIGRHQRTDAS
jgi:hypothetical protein